MKKNLTLRFDDKRNVKSYYQKQIAELNQRLVWWGVLDASLANDTNFSTKTLQAVCDFQEKRNLTVDGIVGTNTWNALLTPSDEILTSSSDLTSSSPSEKENVVCGVNGCSIEPPEHEKLDAGINLIKQIEGLRLSVYADPRTGGKPYTVGYGATRTLDGKEWVLGQKITKQMAEDLLRIHIAEDFLPPLRKIPYWWEMNNNQRSALLSFAYNLGANFYGANNFETITRVLKNREWASVPQAFMLYVNPGSNVEKGLRTRRQTEGQLWSKAE